MLSTQTIPPFTPEALAIVFEKSNFKSFQKTGFLSHYWAPLLSVYSGTRRNEIFFLTPDDVLQKYGTWTLQITTTGSTHWASASATRTVPLHPTLQRLGFLAFVQERRQTHPGERLFSEYKASREQAGMLFSRSFVQWIKTTADWLPAEKKSLFREDFHFPSLRALFSAEAIRSGTSEDALRLLCGPGDESRQAPGEDNREQQCLECADALMRSMDIEAYFPALYTYEELMA